MEKDPLEQPSNIPPTQNSNLITEQKDLHKE